MSAIEYTRCDNPECGRVTPDRPDDMGMARVEGWARFYAFNDAFDLCPDCAKKAMKAVGLE